MTDISLNCKSEYVIARDGVRLAVSTWLPQGNGVGGNKYTAIVTTTRYWRATALSEDKLEFQKCYPFASYLISRGYALVVADARGSGASFGCRETEISPEEVDDIGEVVAWIARKNWCDGRVATEGTSYTANTALYSLLAAPPALKGVVCRAPDFDPYRHLLAPGGIINDWFIEAWGAATCAQDCNDIEALFSGGYYPAPEFGADKVTGVRPVDEDNNGSRLASAIAEHCNNFCIARQIDNFIFVDSKPLGSHQFLFEPKCREKFEKSRIPVVIRCGWHDAATALGALCMFATFSCPLRVILGPWNHSGDSRVDPFCQADGVDSESINIETLFAKTVQFFDAIFGEYGPDHKEIDDQFWCVDYYTLGENRWKTTKQWPLKNTQTRRLYLAPDNQLSVNAPLLKEGSDQYHVSSISSTGLDNRWHAQAVNKPILFPDRREADKLLLVYDTQPLKENTEITGHPVVHLYIRSNAIDGQFFVYLETIDPDGRVHMLTEGQLRGLHRSISNDTPPYKMFGPYHSLKSKDALPLVPGEVAEIAFDLFPISVLLKKGQRIRLAVAGCDADVFKPIPGCETPEISVERNRIYSSCIDLPIIN